MVDWLYDPDDIGLGDLGDVDTTTTPPDGGQALVFDDASGLWIPGGAGGSIAVDDDEVEVVAAASRLNFGDNLDVTDDGGGQVTIDAAGGAGASAFLNLTDTPAAYAGEAGKVAAVNATEDALEFISPGGGGGGGGLAWPTFLVAASGAPADVIAAADYTCDGTDDEVEINAALAALPATGGAVRLSAGTFTLGVSAGSTPALVRMLGAARQLVGEGVGATVLRLKNSFNATAALVEITGAYSSIRDLTVDANRANQSSGNIFGIATPTGSLAVLMHNVRVINCRSAAFWLNGGSLHRLVDCLADNNLGQGVRINGTDDAEIRGGRYTGSSRGIDIVRPRARVIGAVCTANSGPGVHLDSTDAIISGCDLSSNTGAGIEMGSFRDRGTIVGNHIRANGSWGIRSLLVQGVIVGNTIQGNGNHGIDVWRPNLIEGNLIQGNSGFGVNASSGTGNTAAVVGNRVLGNTSGAFNGGPVILYPADATLGDNFS